MADTISVELAEYELGMLIREMASSLAVATREGAKVGEVSRNAARIVVLAALLHADDYL